MEGVTIRHAEVGDAEAFHRIMTAPRVVAGTLRLPYQSVESNKSKLAELPEGEYVLVAVVDGEVIGEPGPDHETRQPTHAACGTYRHSRARRLAGQGDRNGAYGSRAGPRRQLAQPHSDRAACLYRQHRRGSRCIRSSGSRSRAPTNCSPSATGSTQMLTRWRGSQSAIAELRFSAPLGAEPEIELALV